MKKLLFILPFALFSFSVMSQVPGFDIGPKLGFNTRKLSTDISEIKSTSDGSLQLGVFARVGKKFYVQPEVNYVVKGGTIAIQNSEKVKIKLKSITIPLLLGYKLVDAKVFNLRVMAGPAVSMIMNKDVPVDALQANFPVKSKDDLKDSMWSFQFGGGFDVLSLTVDVRYELGIDNIYQGAEDFKMRNNLLNVSLGWKFL